MTDEPTLAPKAYGLYRTRNGNRASVWEGRQDDSGARYWIGTIEGIGWGAWDQDGRSLLGGARSKGQDLVRLCDDDEPL